MAGLMAGKSFEPRNSFLHEKVKFTVSVRGRQWSSARYVQETVEEFAKVIQRNARRLDFIGENDRIQRLQLARADGSEPEELDVDATLEDVIICRGDKHLVAIISFKSLAPCNGSHEAEKLGLSSTMALPYQSKSKVRSDSSPKFQIRYGLATSTSVRPLKETASDIPGLKPVPVLFKRRVASREPPQRRLQIAIPSSHPNPPGAFQDKSCKLTYDFDSQKESFRPQENSSRFDEAIVCKDNCPVALVSSKSTPSPAELAHFLVKGSSLPSNRSTAVSDTSNPFWSKYIGNATPVAGFHSFASALLRRFPMRPPSTMVCGSSTDNVATLAQFLASHIRAVVPGNNDSVAQSRQHCACAKTDYSDAPEDIPSSTGPTETRDKPLEGSGPGERSNSLQFVGNGFDNTSVGGSQEKDKKDPSSSPADTTITSTSTNGCPKSESIHGRSELIFFVNRRSKTGAGAHHLKLSDLSVYFHLSVVDAAKKLGVSQTTLKKACRKFGLKRWPGRKVRSLESTIHGLEQTIAVGQGAGLEHLTEAYIRSEVTKLQQEMDQLVHGTTAQHSPVTRPGDLYKRLYSRGWRSKYHSPSFDLDLNGHSQDHEHLLSSVGKTDHKGIQGSAVVEPNHNSRKTGLDEYSCKENLPDCKRGHKSHQGRSKAMKNDISNAISLDLGGGIEDFVGSCALEAEGTQNSFGNLVEKLEKDNPSLGVVELVTNGDSFCDRSSKRPKLGIS